MRFLLQTDLRAGYGLAVGSGQTDFPETFAVHLRSGANPELHFIIFADKELCQFFSKIVHHDNSPVRLVIS